MTYHVVQNGAALWEVLNVRRPLDGSDLIYDTPEAPRAGDRAVGGSMATPTELYVVNGSGVHHASGRQPGPPTGDLVLGPTLPDIIGRKLARDLHRTRQVAGVGCHELRLAEPASGPIRVASSAGADHDDVCVSSSGLVLDEQWTYKAAIVLRRTASAVRESRTADLPAGPEPVAPPTAGASAPPVAAATVVANPTPTAAVADPPVPAGFQPFGPASSFRLPDPATPAATAAASTIWAFVRGPDIITVEAGVTRAGQLPWRPGDTATKSVHLPQLGAALTAVRSDGSEVRIDLGAKGWVRVRGTVPVTTLVAYAGLLRSAPGT